MNIYWGPAQVAKDGYNDLMLLISFEIYGATIPNNAYVMSYASFPDADNEGKFETVTCTVMYNADVEFSSVHVVSNHYGD